MKVPVYDTPEVRTQPLEPVPSNLNFGGLNDGTQRGLQAVGQVAQQGFELYRASKERADAEAVTKAETAYQATENNRLHDPQNGLMNKRGDAAFQDSGQALEDLQKASKDTAEALLTNDNQRRLYQMRMGGRLEEAHKQIEVFAGQQRLVGQEATLRSGQEQSLTAIANKYADPDVVARQTAAMEGPLRALALSREDGDAKVAEWQQKVVKTRLNQYIAAPDYAGAQALFAQEKDKLGPEASQYLHTITTLGNAVRSDTQAATITKDATAPGYQWLDRGRAEAAVAALPPGPLKDETQKRVEHALEVNEKLKTEAGKDKLGELLSIYEKGGKNPYNPDIAPIKAWMLDPKNGAGELWQKWERELRTDAHTARITDATERRAEAERQKVLLDTFRALPAADQVKANVDRDYLGEGLSDLTRAQMRMVQKSAAKQVQKDNGIGSADFNKMLDVEAQRAGVTQKPQAQAFKAYMNAWRDEQKLAHPDREPPRAEAMKAIAEALRVGQVPGALFGTNTRFQFQAKPGAAFTPDPLDKQKSPLNKTPAPAAPALPAERTVQGVRYVLNPATGKYRKAE